MLRRAFPLALWLICSNAAAQGNDAESLVREGVALREQRRDDAALERFRRAFAIAPTPRTRAQIALAEQALGAWPDAERDMDAALAQSTDAWIFANRDKLTQSLTTVRQHLASIEVVANRDGATVQIDGLAVGKTPLKAPVRVAVGTVTIDVVADGAIAIRRTLSVEAGQVAREQFRLVAAGGPAVSPTGPLTNAPASSKSVTTSTPSDLPASSHGSALRIGGYTALALGGAALLFGGYEGVKAIGDKNARDDVAPGPNQSADRSRYYQNANREATFATVAFGAAALAAGVGVFCLWRAGASQHASVALLPTGGHSLALQLDGEF